LSAKWLMRCDHADLVIDTSALIASDTNFPSTCRLALGCGRLRAFVTPLVQSPV
jgi:hypothetical protein